MIMIRGTVDKVDWMKCEETILTVELFLVTMKSRPQNKFKLLTLEVGQKIKGGDAQPARFEGATCGLLWRYKAIPSSHIGDKCIA